MSREALQGHKAQVSSTFERQASDLEKKLGRKKHADIVRSVKDIKAGMEKLPAQATNKPIDRLLEDMKGLQTKERNVQASESKENDRRVMKWLRAMMSNRSSSVHSTDLDWALSLHIDYVELVIYWLEGVRTERKRYMLMADAAEQQAQRLYAHQFRPCSLLHPLQISLQDPSWDYRELDDSLRLANYAHNNFDVVSRHERFRTLRLKDTCVWFTDSTSFSRWNERNGPALLWCYGEAGTGKSIIMSHVVDYYLRHDDEHLNGKTDRNVESRRYDIAEQRNKQMKQSFAYYYLGRGRVQSATDFSASIFLQLSHNVTEFDSIKRSFPDGSRMPYDKQLELIKGVVNSTTADHRTIVLLDAFDEDNMEDAPRFFEVLKILVQSCHVMIFSRRINEALLTASDSCTTLEITCDQTESDVKRFAQSCFRSSRLYRQNSRQVSVEIERIEYELLDKLARHAQGRFFRCEARMLQLLQRKTLRAFENGLDHDTDIGFSMVDWTLDFLMKRLTDDRDMVRRTLIWIWAATQPMPLLGLCEALSLADGLHGTTLTQLDIIPKSQVLDSCTVLESERTKRGVIVWGDEMSMTAAIAHTDVVDRIPIYWEAHLRDTIYELGTACTRYLLMDDFREGPCLSSGSLKERLLDRPFFGYAACSWLVHYWYEPRFELSELVYRFMSSREHLAAAAQAVLWIKHPEPDLREDPQHFSDLTERSRSMTKFDIVDKIISLELHDKSQKRKPQSVYDLFSSIAADSVPQPRHLQDLILDLITSDSSALDAAGGDCIEKAIFNGDAETVRILLIAAARVTHYDSSRLLATVKDLSLDENGGTLDHKVVRELLQAEALSDEQKISILRSACKSGNAAIVELLIHHGVDITGDSSPLFAAIYGSHLDIVRALLQTGVSTRKLSKRDGAVEDTALHVAVQEKNASIVRLLLVSGVDPNELDHSKRTPRSYVKIEDEMTNQLLVYFESS